MGVVGSVLAKRRPRMGGWEGWLCWIRTSDCSGRPKRSPRSRITPRRGKGGSCSCIWSKPRGRVVWDWTGCWHYRRGVCWRDGVRAVGQAIRARRGGRMRLWWRVGLLLMMGCCRYGRLLIPWCGGAALTDVYGWFHLKGIGLVLLSKNFLEFFYSNAPLVSERAQREKAVEEGV